MTNTLTPDICVIGAGSGGLTVAAAAAAFGVSVVLVEKGKMGGDCLNYGCVPSKALIAAAKHARQVREAPSFGVMARQDFEIAFPQVHDHIHSVIAAIAPNDSEERFTSLGVKVLRETARFTDRRTVMAGETAIRARRFVVATGSSPLLPPIPGLAETPHLTNESLFDLRKLPESLAVIGGGPIGLEMAQAFARLGSRVTVLEAGRALGKDDPELAAIVVDRLRGEGIDIREGVRVERVAKAKGGVELHLGGAQEGQELTAAALLVAAGRKANVADLGLEAAGIAHDAKGIGTNAGLRTSNRRVYAIGDVAGALQFTHVAGYHASLVLRPLLFRLPGKPDHSIVPWCTFTDPELAHVGLGEEEARKRHRNIQVLRWPFHENDRAQAERRTEGFVKIVADAKGRLLGVTIAGAHAGESIHFWALALSKKMTLRDVTGYVAPYPTFSEAGRRAAVSAYAPMARRPLVRTLVNFLRIFG